MKISDLAQDLRSTSGNMERAMRIKRRVTAIVKLFQKVGTHDCTKRVMYIQALLDHIPGWILLWCDLMDLGFGVFTSTLREHLNKVINSSRWPQIF